MPPNRRVVAATNGTSITYEPATAGSSYTVSGSGRYRPTIAFVDDVIESSRESLTRQQMETIQRLQREGLMERALRRTEEIKPEVLKKRHLTKDERARLHKPRPDWIVTPAGDEVCRSTNVLVVDDLLN